MTFDRESQCSTAINTKQLSFIGHFEDGIPTGHCWSGLLGGAWLWGKGDNEGEFSGDDIAYIYPDMKTAFYGKFIKGTMVCCLKILLIQANFVDKRNVHLQIDAQETLVTGVKCENGFMQLQFTEPSGRSFRYNPPSATSFGDQPLVGKHVLPLRYP